MNKVLITFNNPPELTPRVSKNSGFRWGQQNGQAEVLDDKGKLVEMRQVNVNVPYNDKTESYDVWPEGIYQAPYGSVINGYGGIDAPMMQALQKTSMKEAAAK